MQVAMQVALLERQSLTQLQEMWQKYFDTPPISKIKNSIFRGWPTGYRNLPMEDFQVISNRS